MISDWDSLQRAIACSHNPLLWERLVWPRPREQEPKWRGTDCWVTSLYMSVPPIKHLQTLSLKRGTQINCSKMKGLQINRAWDDRKFIKDAQRPNYSSYIFVLPIYLSRRHGVNREGEPRIFRLCRALCHRSHKSPSRDLEFTPAKCCGPQPAVSVVS